MKEVEATTEDRQKWWDELPDEDKQSVLDLPNFDAGIFQQITGIEVNKKEEARCFLLTTLTTT